MNLSILSWLPEQPSLWLLFVPFLLWVFISSVHKETMRKLRAGRVVFETPHVVYDVPLYQTKSIQRSAGSAIETEAVLIGRNDIAAVNVYNRPDDLTDGKAVERAYASVVIYDYEWHRIQRFDYPRWCDNPKPGYQGNPSDHFPDDWNFRTLHPNKSKNRLDLFIKSKPDATAYGFRGYSQLRSKWQDEDLKLEPGRYKVLVKVKGTPMNDSNGLWLELENSGQDASIKVNQLPSSFWDTRLRFRDYWRMKQLESRDA